MALHILSFCESFVCIFSQKDKKNKCNYQIGECENHYPVSTCTSNNVYILLCKLGRKVCKEWG